MKARLHPVLLFPACALFCLLATPAPAQQPADTAPSREELQRQVQQLSLQIRQAQEQLADSQRRLMELQQQLNTLTQALQQRAPAAAPASAAVTPEKPAQNDVNEQVAMQQSQIATLDQAKVESESKYPVKINGLILLNGFVNSGRVDFPASPTSAVGGSGDTGLSMRQTVLGIEAHGPQLGSATSQADLQIDFFGSSTANSYNNLGGLLRLRTAHASLRWDHAEAFFALDRPILNPHAPNSLTAVANPPLAWSGNLWSWNPQVGYAQSVPLGSSARLRVQAALMDVPDPPGNPTTSSDNAAERSRWPAEELRLSLRRGDESGPEIGVGGYFSPHRTPDHLRFDAWAGTLDLHVPLTHGMHLSGNFYRGAALGGLGAGLYKDYLEVAGPTGNLAMPLDDVGGWFQFRKTFGERLEFNTAFGMDNLLASPLRQAVAHAAAEYTTSYQNWARNRTFFANAIYSPSAYLLFSFEYRRLATAPVTGTSWNSNIYGVAAAYRF